MSLISDALNKAQRERAEKAPTASPTLHYPAPRLRRGNPERRAWPFWAGAVVALGLAITAMWSLRFPETTRENRDAPAVSSVVAKENIVPAQRVAPPSGARAQTNVPSEASTPEPGAAADAVPTLVQPSTEYDLAGMTVVGPNTLLSISRRSDRRSIWIPVGKTIGEITAVSYNADTDRAVIRVNGRTLSVRMRDSGPGSGQGAQPAE